MWISNNLALNAEPTLAEHNQLDSLYRQLLKLSEEERAILQDEPSDVIKNLGLLTALRSASEAEAPLSRLASLPKFRKKRNETDGSAAESPGPSATSASDKLNRVKGTAQRSSSVSSNQPRDARDSVTVKVEEGAEPTKGTIAERSGQLVIGAEVVFKHNKNKQGVEGEGIQCIIKGISGDGHKKRYIHPQGGFFMHLLIPAARLDMMSKIPNPTKMANKVQSTRQPQLH